MLWTRNTVLIDGRWHRSDQVTGVPNPATEEIIGHFGACTAPHIDAAVRSAHSYGILRGATLRTNAPMP
ncbi:hypothetical protein EEB13_03275 [Rhodococcus sp. WS3]|uniref:hypothetical protein n=1 Tax=Rhodococcus sp. WS3 TaxID=2486271 RepID=UPI0011437197|nr:hypothetical protein [Rhodococcus sp. WS3]ROZ48994.1 hypothetical protein EEB13_03275 [Rhodococcus sp. WS3]